MFEIHEYQQVDDVSGVCVCVYVCTHTHIHCISVLSEEMQHNIVTDIPCCTNIYGNKTAWRTSSV